MFFASSGINLTMFPTHKDAIFVNFCSSNKIYRSADTPLLLLSYQRSKIPLSSYFYFKTIISLQRVVGFLLLKSCLMALAKTFAFPLPSFWVYCWLPSTMVSVPLILLIRSMTASSRFIFSNCSAFVSNKSC